MIQHYKIKTFQAWMERQREYGNDETVAIYKNRPNTRVDVEPINIIDTHIHDGIYPAQVFPVLATILERSGLPDWQITFMRNHWSWIVSIHVKIDGESFRRDSQDLGFLSSEEVKVQLIALVSSLGGIISRSGHSFDLWGQVVNYPTAKRVKCPMEVFHVFR